MPFSQIDILDVRHDTTAGGDLAVSWRVNPRSTAGPFVLGFPMLLDLAGPVGLTFQVYVNRVLAWYGPDQFAVLPYPTTLERIDVGAVGPGEGSLDFSSSLPSGPNDRALISWTGGTYEDDDLAGFHVYMGLTAGGAVDYTTPVADITAYTQGIILDGAGIGGAGKGGAGAAAGEWSWRSGPLTGGTWNFGVKPYDTAGNEGTARTCSVAITAPPAEPAADANGKRAYLTYDPATGKATVTWNPGGP